MADWDKGFFTKSTKGKVDYSKNFRNEDKEKNKTVYEKYDWELFNPASGTLGKREIRINRSLLNPNEFANYWQTGKHANHRIHLSNVDIDGDGITPDYYAVDPANNVVGFNDRYITDEGKGETPYRRAYYKLDRDERGKRSYMEFLDSQSDIDGWRKISKLKDNRTTSVWNIIKTYLSAEFTTAGATTKEIENVCKQLLKIIQTSFFDVAVPSYQIKVITETPEFKKILKNNVTGSTIQNYLPPGGKTTIVNGMLQLIRGYGIAIRDVLVNWLNTHQNSNRLSPEKALELYKSIIVKKAANKLYKDYGLTAAEAANNATLFEQYKDALKKVQNDLHEKYSQQSYTL